jgi:ankyrin repeat protein
VPVEEIANFLNRREVVIGHYELAEDTDELGRNPLHTATKEGWFEGVRFLIAKCPRLAHADDRMGMRPVVYTAVYNRVEIFELFLRSSVVRSIQAVSAFTGWSFLHYAAHAGAAAVLQRALEANFAADEMRWWATVDVVPEKKEGRPMVGTPLAIACKKGMVECVRILLVFGADPKMVPEDGDLRREITELFGSENRDLIAALYNGEERLMAVTHRFPRIVYDGDGLGDGDG